MSDKHFKGFLHDDTGDNISAKNKSYCELTAQYWAWKNVDADYYGFFHYRRYLYPDEKTKMPYRIEKSAEPALLRKLGYEHFAELIKEYDVIAPIGENMHISVRDHYANAQYHYRSDIELIESIIKDKYPEMVLAMEEYLSGTVCYFGNIYIMKKQQFHDYCSWLFTILEEFDKRADKIGYGEQELRVNGYLAERLFGVWLSSLDNLRVKKVPRVHFEANTVKRGTQNVLNTLLPCGSKRRAFIKRLFYAGV